MRRSPTIVDFTIPTLTVSARRESGNARRAVTAARRIAQTRSARRDCRRNTVLALEHPRFATTSSKLDRCRDDACHLGAERPMLGKTRMAHFEFAEAARAFHNVAAAGEAPLHESLEHSRERVLTLQQLRKDDRILDGEPGTVCAMRRRRMCRVADENDATFVPGRREQEHLERPIIDL